MPHFFITGTDTGVGKTYFTSWLVRSWQASGETAAALKPISAGGREDALLLQAAGGNLQTLDEINPLHLREPAAPLIAAEAEDREIDFDALAKIIATARQRFSHLAVEGVGGWRVPLARNYDVRHWARDLELPVVVIARAGLGTLNHTLLTVESIRAAGVTCTGVVLNDVSEATPSSDLARRTNGAVLQDLLGLPLLQFDRLVHAAGKVPVWLGGK